MATPISWKQHKSGRPRAPHPRPHLSSNLSRLVPTKRDSLTVLWALTIPWKYYGTKPGSCGPKTTWKITSDVLSRLVPESQHCRRLGRSFGKLQRRWKRSPQRRRGQRMRFRTDISILCRPIGTTDSMWSMDWKMWDLRNGLTETRSWPRRDIICVRASKGNFTISRQWIPIHVRSSAWEKTYLRPVPKKKLH